MSRVYVADDNADVRHVVIYSLMDQGHDVVMLKDGEAALEALLAEPPELLILDIMMPGVDGYELLEQMGNWGLHDSTRTIVLTASVSDENRRRALDAGADVFMGKPFDPEELANTAAELLALSSEGLKEWRAQRAEEARPAEG